MYRVFWMVCLGFALLTSITAGEESSRKPKADANLVLEQFDMEKDGDAILLPVELKGKKFLFMLDTGATGSVYDLSLRTLLGIPTGTIESRTATGSRKFETFASPPTTLGKLDLHAWNQDVVAMDMKRIGPISGYPIYGIVGMDFLRKHVVRLDFEKGKVQFLRSAGPNPGRPLRISWQEKNAPFVEGRVSGIKRPELFLIDTGHVGFTSGMLRTELYDVLKSKGQTRKRGAGIAVEAAR